MFDLMTQNSWAMAPRGLVAMLFGIAASMWPGITLWALVALFGAYAMIGAFVFASGALMIALAFILRSLRHPGGEVSHVRHAAPSH